MGSNTRIEGENLTAPQSETRATATMSADRAPSLDAVRAALDSLSVAARKGDAKDYQTQLVRARRAGLTEEQILDCYRWGRRGMGAHPDFDHHGRQRDRRPARDLKR